MWTHLSRRLVVLLLCLVSSNGILIRAEEDSRPDLVIANYNVENFLLDSTGHRFWYKAQAVAKVIVSMNGWEYPTLVGLEEVENDSCVKILCRKLRQLHYDYVHYESPDRRGIDVAMLYDRERIRVINSRPIAVDLGNETTRDILYACCQIKESADTLHILVCHLPSQLGGKAHTEWKREKAFSVIQETIDSIQVQDTAAAIFILGDMNSVPKNNLRGVVNMCIGKKEGTHKHEGVWTWLDQFYCSTNLAERAEAGVFSPTWLLEEDKKYGGVKPKRCNINHYKWQKGYSDHLPVYLKVKYF